MTTRDSREGPRSGSSSWSIWDFVPLFFFFLSLKSANDSSSATKHQRPPQTSSDTGSGVRPPQPPVQQHLLCPACDVGVPFSPACLWLMPHVYAGLSCPNKKLTLSEIPRFTTGSLLLKEKRVTMETIASTDIFRNYEEPLVEYQVLLVWQAVCVLLFCFFVVLCCRSDWGKDSLGIQRRLDQRAQLLPFNHSEQARAPFP